jgi:hypothetical protein
MAGPSPSWCSRVDDSFGPHAGECRGGFDFTLLFEETILTLLPVGLLLVVIPPRAWYLLKRAKKVTAGSRLVTLSRAKLVSTHITLE